MPLLCPPEISKSATKIMCCFFHRQGLPSGDQGIKMGVSFLTVYISFIIRLASYWVTLGSAILEVLFPMVQGNAFLGDSTTVP